MRRHPFSGSTNACAQRRGSSSFLGSKELLAPFTNLALNHLQSVDCNLKLASKSKSSSSLPPPLVPLEPGSLLPGSLLSGSLLPAKICSTLIPLLPNPLLLLPRLRPAMLTPPTLSRRELLGQPDPPRPPAAAPPATPRSSDLRSRLRNWERKDDAQWEAEDEEGYGADEDAKAVAGIVPSVMVAIAGTDSQPQSLPAAKEIRYRFLRSCGHENHSHRRRQGRHSSLRDGDGSKMRAMIPAITVKVGESASQRSVPRLACQDDSDERGNGSALSCFRKNRQAVSTPLQKE